MPGYLIGDRAVLFLHIPKCGGTSVEAALSRAGRQFLLDARFHDAAEQFSRCSAQHFHRSVVSRLFPEGFFDLEFAIVWHPVDRLISEFRFRRDLAPYSRRRTCPKRFGPEPTELKPWLDFTFRNVGRDRFLFDNHVRPQVDFVGPATRVFRLEDGLGPVFAWLGDALGTEIAPPRRRHQVSRAARVEIPPELRRRILDHYAADIAAFGYGED
jgi:hypothetical protein